MTEAALACFSRLGPPPFLSSLSIDAGGSMPQNPSALKRQKELARLEWQREKKEKRRQRKLQREQTRDAEPPGGDTEPQK